MAGHRCGRDPARARDRQRARAAGGAEGAVPRGPTNLPPEVGGDYRLVLDIGCFHGLSDEQRVRMGRQVTAVTGPDATMLMLCFVPGGRGPLPRGADGTDLRRAFPGWSIIDEEAAESAGMPGPLRHRDPKFYRLQRSETV